MTSLSRLKATIRSAAKDSTLNAQDLAKIAREAKKGGVSHAELQLIDREIARFKDAHDDNRTGSDEAHFTRRASQAYNTLRIESAGSRASAFNQRLPSRPGLDDGNRLGRTAAGVAKRFPISKVDGKRPSVFDGLGVKRGEVLSSGANINFGQKKFINGQWCVYVFSARMRGVDKKSYAFSGWVPQRAFKSKEVQRMGNVEPARARDLPGPQAEMRFKTPSESVRAARRYEDGVYKVTRTVAKKSSEEPSDYLMQHDGIVNLLYALPGHGGVSNDTFKLDAHQPIRFVRADVPPQRVPVYEQVPDGHGKLKSVPRPDKDMTFLYGRVVDARGKSRFGWMAKDMLTSA